MSTADLGGRQIEVGVLGATGMVGQQFVKLLAGHPWFKTSWLAASERSEGRSYAEAMKWRLSTPPPADVLPMRVDACTPGRGPRIMFSALDANAANEIEPAFAAAGHIVVSNARSYRMVWEYSCWRWGRSNIGVYLVREVAERTEFLTRSNGGPRRQHGEERSLGCVERNHNSVSGRSGTSAYGRRDDVSASSRANRAAPIDLYRSK